MAKKMKKKHLDELNKKDLPSFWSEVRGLQDKFGISDFRLETRFVHMSENDGDCPDGQELISCPGPNGSTINVCVIKGRSCPKPKDGGQE